MAIKKQDTSPGPRTRRAGIPKGQRAAARMPKGLRRAAGMPDEHDISGGQKRRHSRP